MSLQSRCQNNTSSYLRTCLGKVIISLLRTKIEGNLLKTIPVPKKIVVFTPDERYDDDPFGPDGLESAWNELIPSMNKLSLSHFLCGDMPRTFRQVLLADPSFRSWERAYSGSGPGILGAFRWISTGRQGRSWRRGVYHILIPSAALFGKYTFP